MRPWGHPQPCLALSGLPGLPAPAQGPGTHVSPPGPSAAAQATLQQGWPPAPHSPALPSLGPRRAMPKSQPVRIPREVPSAQGWGCPCAPQHPAPGWVVGPAQPSEWVGCKATQRGQEPATVLTGFLWDVREPAFPGTPRWLSQRGALAQSSRTI